MKRSISLATVFNGVATISPQLLALLVLESSEFGLFSAVYLLFALGISLTLSVLCDPWAMVYKGIDGDAATYTLILFLTSFVFGVFSAGVTVLLNAGVHLVVFSGLCVCAAVYRSGARYYLVTMKAWSRVLGGDILAIIGLTSGVFLSLILRFDSLLMVYIAWLLSSVLASAFGPYITSISINRASWIKEKRMLIRPLLIDSMIMEISSVGTPYMLLPVMGLSNFGVYRGISNLSAPIRLVFAPLRPLIVTNPSAMIRRRRIIFVVLIACVMAGSTFIALLLLSHFSVSIGVLSNIASYRIPAALYVFGSVFLSLYPLVVRASGKRKELLFGRLFQTVVGITFPLLGYFVWGLNGALWLFSVSTVFSAIMWLIFSFAGNRTGGAEESISSSRL